MNQKLINQTAGHFDDAPSLFYFFSLKLATDLNFSKLIYQFNLLLFMFENMFIEPL